MQNSATDKQLIRQGIIHMNKRRPLCGIKETRIAGTIMQNTASLKLLRL